MTGTGEIIEQAHREAAASALRGDDAKTQAVRASILAGTSDDHPMVQAAAFYGSDGFPASVDDLLAADPETRKGMWPDTVSGGWAIVTAISARTSEVEDPAPLIALVQDMPKDMPSRGTLLTLFHKLTVTRLTSKGMPVERIAALLPRIDEFG